MVDEDYGFKLGLAEYMVKPVSPLILLIRVKLTWE